MVIMPNQREELTEEEKRQVKTLETAIDEILIQGMKDEKRYMSYSYPKEITPRVINYVQEMYKKAGWKIRSVADQRDGDYLEFR